MEKYTQEDLAELSMVNIAIELLSEEKKAMDFNELFNTIAEAKGFTQVQKEEFIAQFYTDLNIDGRFMTVGSNLWGLKRWYPVEQIEEELTTTVRKKKKTKKTKKKKEVEEVIEEEEEFETDLDEDIFDEAEDEDFGLDDEDFGEDESEDDIVDGEKEDESL
nr:DNA-directed RNA polymerase subunit delta [Salirhabdus salicampi]